jgi:hypothetical protein
LPDIRTFLDLSTAHLPEQICDRLGAIPGVVAHQTVYGWLMQLPDHPAAPDEHDSAPIPDVVLTIQRYARAAGCAYVLSRYLDKTYCLDPAVISAVPMDCLSGGGEQAIPVGITGGSAAVVE